MLLDMLKLPLVGGVAQLSSPVTVLVLVVCLFAFMSRCLLALAVPRALLLASQVVHM